MQRPRRENSFFFPKTLTPAAHRARRPIRVTPPVSFHPSIRSHPWPCTIISLSQQRCCRCMANWRGAEWHEDQRQRPPHHIASKRQPCSVTREKAEPALHSLPCAFAPPSLFFFLRLLLPSPDLGRPVQPHHSIPRTVPMASSASLIPVLIFFLLSSSAPFLAFASEPRNPEGKARREPFRCVLVCA
jgi:hypothetical protein